MHLKIIYYILFLFFCWNSLFAAKLSDTKIDSNLLRISFENFGFEHFSLISDDKTQINIFVEDMLFSSENKNRKFRSDFFDRYEINSDTIKLYLNKKYGYTSPALPYSNSIIVELFDWNSLDSSNDKFRTALLSFETGEVLEAKKILNNSLKSGTHEAAAFFGFIELIDGKIKNAEKLFLYAESTDTKYYEIYGGLSQIYNILGDSTKENNYKLKFFEQSGLNKVNFIKIKEIDTSTINSFISNLDIPTKVDVNNIAQADTNQQTGFLKESSNSNNQLSEYIIYIALGLVLIILYVYFKWRLQQLKSKPKIRTINKSPTVGIKNKDFDNELDKVKKTTTAKQKQVQKAYQEQTLKKEQTKATADSQHIKKMEISPDANAKLKFLQSALEKNQNYFKSKPKSTKDNQNLSAKAELALHLANEQQKIKQKKYDKLNEELNISAEKINEVAKQMGIEKGSLETKLALNQYMNNKEGMEKLKKKFGRSND